MPYFSAHGPLIPDQLVEDLEDDRVVLFCGAGISMDAGLPSYFGLVRDAYTEMRRPLPRDDDKAWLWPDRMLGELETMCRPGEVRNAVVKILSKDPTNLDYHKALLALGRLTSNKGLRLVTTNFDRYFEKAANPRLELGLDIHTGPMVPIPQDDLHASWRSVVYLHGRLEAVDHPNKHLILTSADFGRAYLTEGWAARFVSRLFAEFSVLFVGYSLNDPVMRYMTDAFAAELAATRRASIRPKAYIFVSYIGADVPSPKEWMARGLTPIFYNSANKDDHRNLRDTLVGWAEARDDWLSSTKTAVERFGPVEPAKLTPSSVVNLGWRVIGRQDDGLAAKVFAGLSPAPSIAWLSEFEKQENYRRQGFDEHIKGLGVNDLKPPAPIASVSLLMVDPAKDPSPLLSRQAIWIAEWLTSCLDRLELIDWVTARARLGLRPHPMWRRMIRQTILKKKGTLPPVREVYWRIMGADADWGWSGRPLDPLFQSIDITAPDASHVFLELFRPYLLLSPSTWRDWSKLFVDASPAQKDAMQQRFSFVAEADVRLRGKDYLQYAFVEETTQSEIDAFVASLADDLTSALKNTLDLWALVGEANIERDRGQWDQPSIQPHTQNHGFRSWTKLIEFVWRGWRVIDSRSRADSRRIVARWSGMQYPTFHRMALAAIKDSPHWTSDEKLEALLNGTS